MLRLMQSTMNIIIGLISAPSFHIHLWLVYIAYITPVGNFDVAVSYGIYIYIYIYVYIYIYIIYIYIYYIYIYICIGYSPGWRHLWAYNTREIIGRGRSPRQLSQGCYMPSKQGYMYFIPW